MILGCTGHRLGEKLGGYKLPNPIYIKVCQETEKLLVNLQPEKCISGMATGYDQIFAFICTKLNMPFIAAVPHIGQENIWPNENQVLYHKLLNKAAEVVIVSKGGYSAAKMQIRNEWIVDNSDQIIGCFDGSAGGTKNCLEYAKSKDKTIHIINPQEINK